MNCSGGKSLPFRAVCQEPYAVSREPCAVSREPCAVSRVPWAVCREPCAVSYERSLGKWCCCIQKFGSIGLKIIDEFLCNTDATPLLIEAAARSCTNLTFFSTFQQVHKMSYKVLDNKWKFLLSEVWQI